MPNGGFPRLYLLRPRQSPGLGVLCTFDERLELVALDDQGNVDRGAAALPEVPLILNRDELWALAGTIAHWVEEATGAALRVAPYRYPKHRERVDDDYDW